MPRPRIELDADEIATAYRSGIPIAALARQHEVDRDVIRRVLDENAIARLDTHIARIGDPRWWDEHRSKVPGMVSSVELRTRAGISYRQLDYWTRTGRLRPATAAEPGSGHLRLFPPEEVSVASLMSALLQYGVQLADAHRMAREFTETGTAMLGPFRIELPQDM